MPKLIVIGGPTASGKTNLAVQLAKKLKTVVLSADSRQFYREMAIGTARPSAEEMDRVEHFFIGSHSIHSELTAASFAKEANDLLTKLFEKYATIILVGGSGMYIDALCNGLHDIPTSKKLRETITNEWKTYGLTTLVNELKNNDPETFQLIDLNNPMRVIRALEVIRLTGKPLSSFKNKPHQQTNFQTIRFVVHLDREVLYERINRRVDLMMEKGLVEEVKNLLPYQHYASLNTVGYKELFSYLDGSISLQEAVEQIKINTRRYAKRQLTWFRRHADSHWISPSDFNELTEKFNLH